jgi:site-specific recombinase XerD
MKIKMTDKKIQSLQPPKTGRLALTDALEPGLDLRVTQTDQRTWSIRCWTGPSDKRVQRRVTLGHPRERDGFPVLSLAAARQAARSIKQAAVEGKALVPGDGLKGAQTFGELAEQYITAIKDKRRPKTMGEVERVLRHKDLASWRDRPAAAISPDDARRLRDAIHERGAGVMATRYLRTVSAMGKWAVSEGKLSESPTRGVKPRATEKERERWLDNRELGAFWNACGRLGYPLGTMGQMLLLTATRLRESGEAEWREFNLGQRLWTIPGVRTKNKKPLAVHMSEPMMTLWREMDERRQRVEMLRSARYLFVASRGGRFVDYARMKAAIDVEMAAELGAPPAPWVLHDLRRSAATKLADLGVAPHVVEKILNHSKGATIGGPVGRIYNKHPYLEQRKDALELLGQHVTALAELKIVPLRRA